MVERVGRWRNTRGVAIVLLVALALGITTYFVSVEVIAQMHRLDYADRPEVENWALPYLNTKAPALINALGVFLIAIAGGITALVFSRRPLRSR